MAGGKLSPRQKMINMMYLVLMALLALNVSKEILKSFHLIEISFNKAQANINAKNTTLIDALAAQSENRAQVVPFYKRAEVAKKIGDDFVNYIQELKDVLEKGGGGRKEAEGTENPKETELAQPDNIEKHANLLFVQNQGAKAKELQSKINETRTKLVELLKSSAKDGVNIDASILKAVEANSDLRAEDPQGSQQTWASLFFEHAPLAGVITLLTKIQNDARNTQAEVINQLAKSIDSKKISFDQLKAAVIAPSSTVMVGEEYKAEVLLVASNSKSDHQVVLSNGTVLKLEDGLGKYNATPNSQGVFEWGGSIKLQTDTGLAVFPFKAEYQAFAGSATISATKMNVLYIGVPNPISVSVPGFAPKDVAVSMVGGSISSDGKGGYNANVTSGREAKISASAKLRDGSSRNMGTVVYRVRPLPRPEAKFGALESGRPSPKEAMIAQSAINASLGEGFAFEGINYVVTSYQFIFVPRREDPVVIPGSGPMITGTMKGALGRAKRGDRVLVDKIRAKGPDGERALLPIIIEIQ
jgi:gliding motility-associated protein GldM